MGKSFDKSSEYISESVMISIPYTVNEKCIKSIMHSGILYGNGIAICFWQDFCNVECRRGGVRWSVTG
jgi:hypothetical protein